MDRTDKIVAAMSAALAAGAIGGGVAIANAPQTTVSSSPSRACLRSITPIEATLPMLTV
ncbi:MAG: hypothetical protein QOI25_3330 [Mycobacterium sp.]|nr:hypothetical protein [Mycobacterium sp.]